MEKSADNGFIDIRPFAGKIDAATENHTAGWNVVVPYYATRTSHIPLVVEDDRQNRLVKFLKRILSGFRNLVSPKASPTTLVTQEQLIAPRWSSAKQPGNVTHGEEKQAHMNGAQLNQNQVVELPEFLKSKHDSGPDERSYQ